ERRISALRLAEILYRGRGEHATEKHCTERVSAVHVDGSAIHVTAVLHERAVCGQRRERESYCAHGGRLSRRRGGAGPAPRPTRARTAAPPSGSLRHSRYRARAALR